MRTKRKPSFPQQSNPAEQFRPYQHRIADKAGMKAIAHVVRDEQSEWCMPHSLPKHSMDVAELAGRFAHACAGQNVAHLSGLWHDIGKYQVAWQCYLRRETNYDDNYPCNGTSSHPNHSTAGAMLAIQRFDKLGRVLAYLIAGHHAGLYDWHSAEAGEGRGLEYRLRQSEAHKELADSLATGISDEILQPNATPPDLRNIPGGKQGFALWIRMLFSCLVDADFLDTEAYMSPDKAQTRSPYPSLAELKQWFDTHMAELKAGAKATEVNKVRASILDQCRAKAKNSSNLYTLTVPTGGGKTLASMAFALDHAIAHGKDRIIYVIPYTSIIEQTAKVYRTAFGDLADAVIEHHSSAEYEDKVEGEDKNEFSPAKLATENWDARIIVTTNVQFFESLFAAKTSRCRKLHNIANSVVVIDEAQMMHPSFWQPMVSVLDLLRKHYGTTLVMSTATQPCFESVNHFADPKKHRNGLDGAVELMDAPTELYSQLKRVEVHVPTEFNTRRTWEEIAAEIAAHPSVLAIVNTRKDARELFALMPEGTIHLSALMCGEHRSRVIADIKQRLKEGQPTRVVSTQLVEAGVDFDFPVVYRAMAGLDSIAQAAGRCNREGLLPMGHTHVFIPPSPSPPGMLRKGEDACRSVLHGHTGDPLDIGLFKQYFNHLYYNNDLDQHGISSHLRMDGRNLEELAVNFRTAADLFKLIDNEDYVPVVVRYKKDEEDHTVERGLAVLGKGKPERWVMRSLQRYIVNVRRKDALRMLGQRTLDEVLPGLFAQVGDGLYHRDLGLQTDEVKLTPDQYLA
ncbi:MAG: CRISPR-associated helicase Cas3' [Flavobacteriales bacterium]